MKNPNASKVTDKDKVIDVPFDAFGKALMVSILRIVHLAQLYECVLIHPQRLYGEYVDVVPVRFHSSCLTSEVFSSASCDCAWQLRHAVEYIAAASNGIVVYFPWQEGRGAGLFAKISSIPMVLKGMDSADAFRTLGYPVDARDFTPGVLVLRELGITRVALITNNPAKIRAVEKAGIEVVERIPSVTDVSSPVMQDTLRAKARLGHLL